MILNRLWNQLTKDDIAIAVAIAVAIAAAAIAAVAVAIAAVAIAAATIAAAAIAVAIAVAAAAIAVAAVAIAAVDNKLKMLLFIIPFILLGISFFFISEIFLGYSFWYVVPLFLFVLMELCYWVEKPEKNYIVKNWIGYILKKKLSAFLDGFIIFITANLIKIGIDRIVINWSEVLKWIGYIGAGLVGLAILCGIIYGWLLLNKLKYKKVRKEVKNK